MRLKAGVVSDCGHVRSANEDSFLLRPGLYAVCDGMGGARAGEVASQMACLGLLNVDPLSAGEDELRQAIIGANRAIVQRSSSEGELLGMGTTLTAVLVKDGTLLLAHVGDSRAYLLHEGSLAQVTSDHSWVGEMVRRGELTLAEAARHPHRSVITRALGTDVEVYPDVAEVPVVAGDRVMLCSDGLSGMVDDKAIAQIMKRSTDPQATAQSLVDAALANGGDDNVTVVVVDVEAGGEDSAEGEAVSWADSRVLIGPSDREAPVPVSSHEARRARAAARELLGRRGTAIPRPGSRMSVGRRSAGEQGVPAEASEAGEAYKASETARVAGAAAAAGTAGAEETAEAVDAHEAVVPPPSGKKARKGGSPAGRGRSPWWRRRWFIVTLTLLLLIVVAVGGFAWYSSTVYYVGDDEGKVALYRGLPVELLGIEFSTVFRTGTVDYESLSSYLRARVDAHDLVSREEGEQFLDGLSTER